MERIDRRLIFAVLLIGAGILFLLQNLGIIPQVTGLIWAGIFVLAGLSFLALLVNDRRAWWAAIPGIILVDLGALITAGELFPSVAGRLGGPFFLAGIGLAFVVVYFLNQTNWWAIIPAGVMLTLAVVAGLEPIGGSDLGGGIFFIGLGLTFGLLGLLQIKGRRVSWPWIPAAVLFGMGVLILFSAINLINYAWPVVLIVAGCFLLFRAYTRRISL